jgi:hypothetical protein
MKVVSSVSARWAILVGLAVFSLSLISGLALADPTWEVGVAVSSSDIVLLPVNLSFGVDPAALEGEDSLDAVAPPPPPGPPYLYAYFIAGPTRLFTDIRPDVDETITWQGVIWNSQVETFYVVWDPAALPDTGNFSFDTTIDMRIADSATVTGTWNPMSLQYEYLFTITRSFIGTLSEIVVSPDPADVVCLASQQFTAEGFDEFGNPIETDPTWSVAPGELGTVDENGLFTAAQGGSGWVIATDGDVVDSAVVNVLAGAVAMVEVAPTSVTVICNQNQQFTATGYDACDTEVAIDPVWSLSNPDLGTIDGVGLFMADKIGIGYVIATVNGYADSAQVTVIAGAIEMVEVTPESAMVLSGEQQQFAALGIDECGNETAFVGAWSVDPVGLGTIDAAGLFTGGQPGSGWVYAEASAGRFRTNECDPPYLKATDVTTCDAEAWAVDVELAEAVGAIDAFSMDVTYNTAHMTFVDHEVTGYLVDGWTVVGVSENTPGVITVGGLTIGDPIAGGTSGTLLRLNFQTIEQVDYAESQICMINLVDDFATGYNICCGTYLCEPPPPPLPKDSAYVVVLPREATGFLIDPEEATVKSGYTFAFAGIALGEGFQWDVTDETTFETNDPLGTMVDNVYTAGQVGMWLITATYDTFTATAEVTVEPGDLATMEMSPTSADVSFGLEQCFTVVGADINGNAVIPAPVWSLSTPDLGEIDQNGCFTADSVETSGYVIATEGAVSDSAFVTVMARGEPIGITVYPQDTTVASGQTVTYVALATDGHIEWDVTDETAFDATDSCCVWYNNIYEACFVGTWAVIGMYDTGLMIFADTAIVHVSIGPIVEIEVTPETTVVSGSEMTYFATGYDANGNATDLTASTDFTTTDPCGSLTDNVYMACQIGTWEITGTYLLTLTDTVPVEVTPFQVILDLEGGWNMVSLPVVPEYYRVDSLFPGNVGVFGWNGIDYVTTDVFEIGYGYWLALLEAATVTLSGVPVLTYTRDVIGGWNMVGSISIETDTSAFEATPAGILFDNLNWYDPTLRKYVKTDIVDPGKGYWFPTLDAGVLTLNEAPAAKSLVQSGDVQSYASITVTRDGISRVLEFGFDTRATEGFDLALDKPVPPPSPTHRFDAYFTFEHEIFTRYQRDVRPVGSTSTWTMEIQGGTAYTLDWDITAVANDLDAILVVNGRVVDMRATQSITVDEGGHIEISVGKGLIVPSEFTLAQNYPNPFNPETEILYTLPHSSRTTITIYNVLGQVVNVLVDEYQPAGSYRVQWDGQSHTGEGVASGVYFCRMQAGDFVATNKMVLMK